jgi:protein TonB
LAVQSPQHLQPSALRSPPSLKTNADPPKRAGVNGVGVPTCQYCPAPTNKKSENATVVLQVVVTLDGRAENISALKGLNDDLIQTAIDTVKTWRFKPARDANDKPVATVVPIDVTFRNHK